MDASIPWDRYHRQATKKTKPRPGLARETHPTILHNTNPVSAGFQSQPGSLHFPPVDPKPGPRLLRKQRVPVDPEPSTRERHRVGSQFGRDEYFTYLYTARAPRVRPVAFFHPLPPPRLAR